MCSGFNLSVDFNLSVGMWEKSGNSVFLVAIEGVQHSLCLEKNLTHLESIEKN